MTNQERALDSLVQSRSLMFAGDVARSTGMTPTQSSRALSQLFKAGDATRAWMGNKWEYCASPELLFATRAQ